jgi:hypothetical protein
MPQILKNELRAIISGKSQVRHGAIIQAVIGNLGASAPTSTTTQGLKQVKSEEAECISAFAQ